jgi:hypothetical protein
MQPYLGRDQLRERPVGILVLPRHGVDGHFVGGRRELSCGGGLEPQVRRDELLGDAPVLQRQLVPCLCGRVGYGRRVQRALRRPASSLASPSELSVTQRAL